MAKVCNSDGVSYAWIDPNGKVYDRLPWGGHGPFAVKYIRETIDDSFDDSFDEYGYEVAINFLLEKGWIRVVNFAVVDVWDTHRPPHAAWRSMSRLLTECVEGYRNFDMFREFVLVSSVASGDNEHYSVSDLITKFVGRQESEAFFEKLMTRTAATSTVDKSHIDALRRDVLMIARAADNVTSLEDIDKVTLAVRAWRNRWDTFAFTLRQDLEGRVRASDLPYDPTYNPNPPDKGDAEYYLNRALTPMWEFNSELNRNPRTDGLLKDSNGNPWKPPEEAFEETVGFYLDRGYSSTREDAVREAHRYHDRHRPLLTRGEAETAAVARWKVEAVKWTRRLRDKARKAWDTLNGYVTWLGERRGGNRPLEVVHPDEEVVSISGFRVVFRGFAESPYKDKLEAVREGLARYRAGAAARAPILLKNTPPIFVEWTFEPTTGGNAAGYYTHNRVNITPWVIGDNIDGFVKTLAHEVGHHLFKVYLSGDATTAWSRFIRGDYRDLNLREALAVMERVGASSVVDKSLMAEDPILHLQLSTLMHDLSYKHLDFLFADNIRSYLDTGGSPSVRVPVHPISGYAAKNSEEAFCEALGNLVAYGPKAVPDVVLGMLRSVVGGGVKIASRLAAAWWTRTASGVSGFHGWGMSPEAMRLDGPQFTDQKPIPPEDIEAAADYLKEVRPGLLVAYSRGGAVAMLSIRDSGVRPKVIWVAPAWKRGWATVTPPSVSGVILHGDQDNAVPLQHSCQLADRTGLPLRVIPGRNHINILKDKSNPSAGVPVPSDRVRECIDTLPDWGSSAKGSPDDVAKQEEFVRSLTAARRKRPATGDCYEAAGRYITEHSLMSPSGNKKSNLRLVHGEVAGQGSLEDVTFGHAWVLDGNTVIDRSNGRDISMPKDLYYFIGRINELDNVHVYTPEQARERMLRYKHFGPWDLKTRSGL